MVVSPHLHVACTQAGKEQPPRQRSPGTRVRYKHITPTGAPIKQTTRAPCLLLFQPATVDCHRVTRKWGSGLLGMLTCQCRLRAALLVAWRSTKGLS